MTAPPVTVLIVDDDVMHGELYRLALEHAGNRVLEANDGASGLEVVQKASPDVIVLDVRMPGMDGVEMLRRLKALESTRDIPVLMLSNFDEPALVRKTVGLGARGYLVKVGTDPGELAAIVSTVLKSEVTDSLAPGN